MTLEKIKEKIVNEINNEHPDWIKIKVMIDDAISIEINKRMKKKRINNNEIAPETHFAYNLAGKIGKCKNFEI